MPFLFRIKYIASGKVQETSDLHCCFYVFENDITEQVHTCFEIADTTLEGADRLLAKHPDAPLYSLRIGYAAVYSFGGSTFLFRRW